MMLFFTQDHNKFMDQCLTTVFDEVSLDVVLTSKLFRIIGAGCAKYQPRQIENYEITQSRHSNLRRMPWTDRQDLSRLKVASGI